ncbi:ROK family protein [Glutamicibacter creatinolyticus]|uniref:ROK family transcriptional regulator n=1 Tax=Glutamicibacter TaxID=1742989 RepID=UPI0010FEB6B1|nr:ROK family transcriptional regulator [Glutamicibacter sp. V16R2B1]TLK57063.1 ROK family transcriptional regulator [Glutamicibacter sp. V16R2B1]
MASGNLAADIIHRIAVEPVTRSALAREFELAPSTISAKVNELTEAGLIVEGGAALSRGGRPGKLLTLRYQSGRLGVISMGSRHARVGVADMSRKILSIREVRIDVGQGVDATLDTLWAALRQVAAEDGGQLLAVGLCLPGPVDVERGVVVSPSRMPGWHNQPVAEMARQKMGIPVNMDNDANLAALGEYLTRGDDAAANSITLIAGSGIGSGIMANGELFRGSSYAAGDITHTKVEAAGDRLCSCGNRGCLETIASGAAIVRDLAAVGTHVDDIHDVIQLVRDGHPAANGVVREAGRQLGLALSTVVNFFNPGDVYLTGTLSSASVYVAAVRSQLYERCLPMATSGLRVEAAMAGAHAGLIGAAEIALIELLSQPSLPAEFSDPPA